MDYYLNATPIVATDAKTLILANLVPNLGTNATLEQVYVYQQRIRSLNFAATYYCPNIAKAISKLYKFS